MFTYIGTGIAAGKEVACSLFYGDGTQLQRKGEEKTALLGAVQEQLMMNKGFTTPQVIVILGW